jgi:hypothetical protein
MSMQWLWWAPFVAALAHITEQYVYPGVFAKRDRADRSPFRNAAASRFHPIGNAVFLALCVRAGLVGTGGISDLGGIPPEYNAAFWLLLVTLMFSHALTHVTEAYRTRRVSPGLWTALLLYAPLAVYGYWRFFTGGLRPVSVAILAALAGASFRFWPFLLGARHASRCQSGLQS